MKLDLLYEIDVPKPWGDEEHPVAQRREERRRYSESLEQIKRADSLGFDTVWCVEHHFREGRSHMPASEVVLGALSQCTQNIRLGFGVTLTPHEFIHPARVAEKVATVDLLSNGRAEWGIGRSTPMEQSAFGVDPATSKHQMLAAAKSIAGMWREEYYSENSEYLNFPPRMITPKPWQDPHPPCWMAVTSDSSAAVAGENGLGMLAMSILNPLEKVAELVASYRAAHRNCNPLTDVINSNAAVYTLVCCVEDRADLEKYRVWDGLSWWYTSVIDFQLKWEWNNISEADRLAYVPFYRDYVAGTFNVRDFDDQDMIIVGTPDECAAKLKRYKAAGLDKALCYHPGPLGHRCVMRSLELLGRHVIPQLGDTTQPALVTAASQKG